MYAKVFDIGQTLKSLSLVNMEDIVEASPYDITLLFWRFII